jgi:hypothetical protein
MAIIDVDSLPWFNSAQFQIGLDTSESGFRGFYTGNSQRSSTLSDRLTGVLTLPATNDKLTQGAREALLFQLRSRNDYLQMAMPQRRTRRGDLAGSPTTLGAALAGARQLTITGGYGTNLLLNPSFERSTISPWAITGGTVTAVRSADAQIVQPYSVKVDNSTSGGGHYLGQLVACRPSTAYTLSAFVYNHSVTAGAIDNRSISLSDVPLVAYAQDATLNAAHPQFVWTLKFVTITTGPSATLLDVRLYAPQGRVYWDAIQLIEGASPYPTYFEAPTLLPGDYFGVGGNLLQVAMPGSVRDANDDLTVPLSMPLPKALASGSPVIWNQPKGLWEWDGSTPDVSYSPGQLQSVLTIPLRQVIA